MKIVSFLAAAAAACSLAVPAGATPPPHPASCLPKIEAVATPPDVASLVATGRVAVGAAQVVCTRDLLNSTPNDDLAKWWGHITIYWQTSSGYIVPGCGHGPDVIDAVGPVLVLHAEQTCVVSVNDSHRGERLDLVVIWATLDANTYDCCVTKVVPATPVGVL